MKRKLISVMMCLSALCMGFTSCGDKDDEKENDNYGQTIAGTYSGNLLMENEPDPIVSGARITIARDDDRHVTLKMNETVMNLPVNIECKSDVTYSNNLYQVTGNTTFNMSMGEVTLPVPVVVNGTIDRNGKASININVDVPAGAVAVVFDGQRQ
jgi:hypothetical protein